MSLLEDLVCPGHAVGHGRTKTKADDEQATVAGPVIGEGKGNNDEANDLDDTTGTEEDPAVFVEAVGEWGRDEDSEEVHLLTLVGIP